MTEDFDEHRPAECRKDLAPSRPIEARPKIGGWPLAAGIGAALAFLFFVRYILLPFAFAAAAAFVLAPVIDDVRRRTGLPRWIIAIATQLCVLGAFGLLAYYAGRLVVHDLADLSRQLPTLLHDLLAKLADLSGASFGVSFDAAALTNRMLDQARASLTPGAALSFAGDGMAALVAAILAVVLLAYFLVSGKEIAAGVLWLIPPEYRRDASIAAAEILPLLRRYFTGLLVIVTYTTLVAWLGFGLVFHVPRAVLLAFVVGIFELVPVIGPTASAVLVALTAIHQASIVALAGLIGFAVVLRISIDQLVGPLVLGQAARLHPVVIIFAFLSGAVLFGVVGLLLAVPVAASIKIILTIYYSEPVAEASHPVRDVHDGSARR